MRDLEKPKTPAETQKTREAEIAAINSAMTAIKPEEWLRRIMRIFNMVTRIRVANIVWWDYFAGKRNSKPHLNGYIQMYIRQMGDHSVRKIAKGLAKVGYPSGPPYFIAERRAGVKIS
jgi:hypothetical protein